MSRRKNKHKSRVKSFDSALKMNPSDEEVIQAILNGYTVTVLHFANGKEVSYFEKKN